MKYMKMSTLAEKLNARNGDQISKNLIDFWFISGSITQFTVDIGIRKEL